MPRDERQRLNDILKAIANIEQYKGESSREEFGKNKMQQDAILLNLAIIGEAIGAVSDTVKAQNPTLSWVAMKRMRNIVIHAYFGVSLDIVWQTITQDLEPLREQIEAILRTDEGKQDEEESN